MKTHLLFVLLSTTLPSTIPGFQQNYEANTTVYITDEHVKRREIAEPGYNKYYPKSSLPFSSPSANIAPSVSSSLVKARSPQAEPLYTYPIYSEIAPQNLSTNYLPVDSTPPLQTPYLIPPPPPYTFGPPYNFGGSDLSPSRSSPELPEAPVPISFQRSQPPSPFPPAQPPPLIPLKTQTPQPPSFPPFPPPPPPSLPPFPPPPPQSPPSFQPPQSSLLISSQQSPQPPSLSEQSQPPSSFQFLKSPSQSPSQPQQPQPKSPPTPQSQTTSQQSLSSQKFVFQQAQIPQPSTTEPPSPQIRVFTSTYTSNTSTASPPTLTATPPLKVSTKLPRPITTVPDEVLNLRNNADKIPNAIVLPDPIISPSSVQASNQTIITVAINNNVIIDLKSTLKKLDVSQGGKDKESEQVVHSN